MRTVTWEAGTGAPIMKMQPRSIMQVGVMPLQGIGELSELPSYVAIVMSALACMAAAGMACSIDAWKNATATRIANRRLRRGLDMIRDSNLPARRVQPHSFGSPQPFHVTLPIAIGSVRAQPDQARRIKGFHEEQAQKAGQNNAILTRLLAQFTHFQMR